MTIYQLRKRGAKGVLQANGELLFLPTGDVGRWKNRFSANAQKFTAAEAPSNKRPRWAHYGLPLKRTINRSSTRFVKTRAGARLYSVVGSTAPYSAYVDQGTGIYNGGSPYRAKVLPPWRRGEGSLYEASWRPPSGGTAGAGDSVWSRPAVRPVYIAGQQGQFFFDAGLRRTFRAMRVRQSIAPIGGLPGQMSQALSSMPAGLEDGFSGATPVNSAFVAQLQEWRQWRDERFNSGRVLGRDGGSRTAEGVRRRGTAERSPAREGAENRRAAAGRSRQAYNSMVYRRRQKAKQALNDAKSTQKPKQAKVGPGYAQRKAAEKQRFLAAAARKYGQSNIDRGSLEFEGGYWYVTVKVMEPRPGDGALRPGFKEIRGRRVE